MSYITEVELKDYITERELIQLTDDAKTGEVDSVKVAAAITAAGAEIDAYAATRYAVPLQLSEKVKQLARDIAIWHLEKRRRRIREDTQKAYDLALAFLKDLAAGRAQLDQPATAAPQSGGQLVRTTECEEVFSDENLDRF